VELTYYGHACFLLSAADGTSILIDPFNTECGYPIPDVAPTAVTVSHEHFDHNHVAMAKGSPTVIRGLAPGGDWARVNTAVGEVRITTVPTYHDASRGAERGRNAVFIYEVEGMRVVHLGDLGHTLDADQAGAIGRPDVLMVPVGGHYTIGPEEATQVVEQLAPRLVIPMHYKTPATAGWPIGPVDPFLSGKPNVAHRGHTVTIRPADLPPQRAVWVLAHQG